MGFRRELAAPDFDRDSLTAAMVGIGMLFAAKPSPLPNIEDTLVAASVEGMERGDLRVLAVLTTWLGIHSQHINADRLVRAVTTAASPRVRLYWAAIAAWRKTDARLARIRRLHVGGRESLVLEGSDFLIRRHGEDPRFANGPMKVPLGTLRDRPADVLTPEQLVRKHRGYYWRVVIGPSYRADMWSQLEAKPELSAAELARRTYGSFATAWAVRRDFALTSR